MLCALLQFGSLVSAVNNPSPPTARTRRSEPRTALSKRFSSESSSIRSWPPTMTSGAPIMSSQKIGPSSLMSRVRCCTGAFGSSDSILPTTGFFGGCGIGFSLFGDAIVEVSPACLNRHCERSEAIHRSAERKNRSLRRFSAKLLRNFVAELLAITSNLLCLSKPLPTPFDQLGADLIRLFLLRPMATVAHQVFFQIGDDLLHAVGGRR